MLLIFAQLQHSAEAFVGQPRAAAWINRVTRLPVEVDRIAGEFFQPGTVARLADNDASWRAENEAFVRAIETELNAAFGRAHAGVDPFLDWYYSLGAEFGRVSALVAGRSAQALESKLQSMLTAGGDGQPLGSIVQLHARRIERVHSVLSAERAAILDEQRVTLSDNERPVVANEIDIIPDLTIDPVVLITLESRMWASAGAGSMASIAGSQVARRLAARGVFQRAALTVANAAAGRRALVAAGAAGGAAAGSVVPGLGTLIGGAVGGAGALLATNWMLLKVEEQLSRDALSAEIHAAIDVSEAELRQSFGLE